MTPSPGLPPRLERVVALHDERKPLAIAVVYASAYLYVRPSIGPRRSKPTDCSSRVTEDVRCHRNERCCDRERGTESVRQWGGNLLGRLPAYRPRGRAFEKPAASRRRAKPKGSRTVRDRRFLERSALRTADRAEFRSAQSRTTDGLPYDSVTVVWTTCPVVERRVRAFGAPPPSSLPDPNRDSIVR